MAYPTISVDSTGGSSDTTASGAGPSTAISGSTGRTRNTASQLHFGMFGATDDFSGVATDGSAVLYMAISTAGQRNFSSIAATKNTRHVDIGSITSGAAILSAIVSTSGWSVGDVIKVTGAGAASADLYSTILTVDSAVQVTLNDNAGTTVVAAVVENPKQFTLTASQGVNTGSTNTAWAVGGKRATIGGTNSKKLVDNNSTTGDMKAGWIVEMQSGHSETLAATLNFYAIGSFSAVVTLRGVSGAAARPVLIFSNNGIAISIPTAANGSQWLEGFELKNSNATKTSSSGIDVSATNVMIKNVKISNSNTGTTPGKFWRAINDSGNRSALTIDGCELGYNVSYAIALMQTGCMVTNCWIHDGGLDGIYWGANRQSLIIHGNLITTMTGDGIKLDAVGLDYAIISHNTINNCSDGIDYGSAGSMIMILNNLISNCTAYGMRLASTFASLDAAQGYNSRIVGNCMYNNASGNFSVTGIDEGSTTGVNPSYTSSGTNDYSIGTALNAKGSPLGGSAYVGNGSTTYSYIDPGAAQRQEAGGSGGSGGYVIGS